MMVSFWGFYVYRLSISNGLEGEDRAGLDVTSRDVTSLDGLNEELLVSNPF
jgi:hypothetical protein